MPPLKKSSSRPLGRDVNRQKRFCPNFFNFSFVGLDLTAKASFESSTRALYFFSRVGQAIRSVTHMVLAQTFGFWPKVSLSQCESDFRAQLANASPENIQFRAMFIRV